jgi:hypothetical protein
MMSGDPGYSRMGPWTENRFGAVNPAAKILPIDAWYTPI